MAAIKPPSKPPSKPRSKKLLAQPESIVINSDDLDINNIQPIKATSVTDTSVTATNVITSKPKITRKKTINLNSQVTDTKPQQQTIKTHIQNENMNDKEENLKPIDKPIDKPIKIIKTDNDDINNNQEILLELDKDNKDKTKNKNKHQVKKNNVLSTELFNDEELDYRTILMNYDFTKNITKPKITKYEKALLVGKRAKQLEEGANANVKVLAGQSMIDVAEEELRQRLMPFMIKRPIGNLYEYWRLKDMEVNMD